MYRAISSEFLKLRRSKLLLLVIISAILPSMVKFIQYLSVKDNSNQTWETFLTSGKEILVMSILITVMLASGFIFTMEYHFKTISYILTSGISKTNIYISKMVSALLMILLLLSVSCLSELVFGSVLFGADIPGELIIRFFKVALWYLVSYFLLSSVILLLGVLTKKFVITSVIASGFLMLSFPFQLKQSIYACPFMTPWAVAAKIYGYNNYVFNDAYRNVNADVYSVFLFLMVLALISTIAGIACFTRTDSEN